MKPLFFLLLVFWQEALFSQKIFYLSSKGNDAAAGTTQAAPKKNIVRIAPGGTYYLNRGDTFYFSINKIDNPLPANKVLITAYGTGAKPVISLYKKIKPASWKTYSGNVWKVSLRDTLAYTGFMNNTDTNVGFIKVDGNIMGNKLSSIPLLKADWDFFSDSLFLYVFCSVNPSKKASSIQVACNFCILRLSDNMEINNITLMGTGGHGIQGVIVNNIAVKNVEIQEVGGSYLSGYKLNNRYGNGIEFYYGSTNCLIEGCRVIKAYDAAFTMQGNGNGFYFTNIVFNNNYATLCQQSFEFWVKGWKSGFRNCRFTNNYCTNAGNGWSSLVRPDKGLGVHICNYAWEVDGSDLVISGNTFSRAKAGYIFVADLKPQSPLFTSVNNKVFLDLITPVMAGNSSYKVKSGTGIITSYGLEKGSIFSVLTN